MYLTRAIKIYLKQQGVFYFRLNFVKLISKENDNGKCQ